MLCAEFENLIDAQIYRKNHGGWIFYSDYFRVFWFSPEFTQTRIINHSMTKGMSGKLM